MTATLVRAFGEMAPNALGLELQVTTPICEGMNRLLASFQALYLQYQKHHFVVEGSEFYMLHQYFQHSYEQVAGHTHDLGERLNNLGASRWPVLPAWQSYACLRRSRMGCLPAGKCSPTTCRRSRQS